MTSKEIVLAFIKAINDHDVDKIYDLMSDDHIFIDGSGGIHVGKTDMKVGWKNPACPPGRCQSDRADTSQTGFLLFCLHCRLACTIGINVPKY